MLKHISQKHTGPNQDEIVKKHECEECGRRFVSSEFWMKKVEIVLQFLDSSLAGHKKVHNKQTIANFTKSAAILKPQERVLQINGHTKPKNSRPLKMPVEELFVNSVLSESHQDGPVEDMPDLF